MLARSIKLRQIAIGSAAFVAAFSFALAAYGQQAGPFASLAGTWSGTGTLTLSNGPQERIRCRAKYDVSGDGSGARLELRCASDSYKFELQGNAVSRNGDVSGNWNETTRQVAGRVTGTAKDNRINLRVESQTFSALLSLNTEGDRQSISIQAPAGNEMSEASIAMRRGS